MSFRPIRRLHCKYRAAALDGVCDSDGFSRNPPELLSHEKRLREKTLQLASTRHGAPIPRTQLFDAEQRDDFLEFFVACNRSAHFFGDGIVLFANDERIQQHRS